MNLNKIAIPFVILLFIIILICILLIPALAYYGQHFVTYRNEFNIQTKLYQGNSYKISFYDSMKIMFHLFSRDFLQRQEIK